MTYKGLVQAKLACKKCEEPMLYDIEKHLYVCESCSNNPKVVTKKALS